MKLLQAQGLSMLNRDQIRFRHMLDAARATVSHISNHNKEIVLFIFYPYLPTE
jgi:hypothetical protein